MKKSFWIWIVVILLIVAAVFVISTRNDLIAQDEAVGEQWGQIDAQLQRRNDLIPNLVASVKGYAAHEKEIFSSVANARSSLLAAKTPEEKAEASAQVSASLGRLLAIAENYPDLKADGSFHRLMDELAGTENRIAVARTRYNQSVKEYNRAIRQFPGSLFASGMGLEKRGYFNPPAGHQAVETAPEVKF
ncbi:MAG: LemA family protein [Victivallaceae bacterium]|nr:LemA family protein [Victivallaceae bacterium]